MDLPDAEEDDCPYLPTRAQILEECARIQSGWGERERRKRCQYKVGGVQLKTAGDPFWGTVSEVYDDPGVEL